MSTDILLQGIIYLFLGAFAGIMAGVLGVGGGLIVVPGLVYIFRVQHLIPESALMHVAAGSSLAVMIVTSLASIKAHNKRSEVLWSVFYKLLPGIMAGTLGGALISDLIPTAWLEVLFGVFIVGVAIKMLVSPRLRHEEHWPSSWVNHLVSTFIGLNAGLLGVGGGLMIIPYLAYCGVALRKIAAISNLCTLAVASVGTSVFILTGWQAMQSIPYTLGYIYLPAVLSIAIPSSLMAPLGAQLNHRVPVHYLKCGFIILLLITAITLIFGSS